MEINLKLKEVAELYDVSQEAVRKWVERGFPKSKRGSYPLKEGHDWWKENIIGDLDGETSLAEEKLKYQKWRASREELTVKELQGELISTEKVADDLSFVLNGFKRRITGWARGLPGILAHKDEREIYRLLLGETYFILDELSKGVKRIVTKSTKHKKPGISKPGNIHSPTS